MTLDLMTALQWGDSSFPNGSFGFSWGLESAIESGIVTREKFSTWLEIEILDRWCNFDKKVIERFWDTNFDNYAIEEERLDKYFWAEKLRKQSIQAGTVFLESAARFGNNMAIDLNERFNTGDIFAHLSPLQGCIYRDLGLSLKTACMVCVHGIAQQLISAGVRLHLISSIEGQQCYRELIPIIYKKICQVDNFDDLSVFSPFSELAMLSENPQSLFIN